MSTQLAMNLHKNRMDIYYVLIGIVPRADVHCLSNWAELIQNVSSPQSILVSTYHNKLM